MAREMKNSASREQSHAGMNSAEAQPILERKLKDSGVKWIGELPRYWGVSKIKYHCEMQSGDNLTSNDIEPEGEYEVYGANGFRGYYDRYNCEGTHILIGRQGALAGNVHIVDGKYWATDHAVVTKLTDSTNDRFNMHLKQLHNQVLLYP